MEKAMALVGQCTPEIKEHGRCSWLVKGAFLEKNGVVKQRLTGESLGWYAHGLGCD